MGCSASQSHDDIIDVKNNRRNTIVVKPKASISIGQGIGQNISNDSLTVVFIFGGPGCGKGSVVHNLVNAFNFKFLNAELCILRNVAKQFNVEGVTTTSELRQLIKENSFEVTLNWVLSIMKNEIEQNSQHPILIDVIPNMKFFSKKGSMVRDCEEDLKQFELDFPISFAINLHVNKEHLINKTHKSHASVKTQQKEDSTKTGPSDEVDTSRTYKRFQKYEESVRDFIEYFKSSERLLTVDTSSGRNDIVWDSIKEYFLDSDTVEMMKPVEIVILFCFAQEDVNKIDKHRYPLKDIDISDLVNGKQERSLVNILIGLAKFLKHQKSDDKYFIINLEGVEVSLKELSKIPKKTLMFEEIAAGQLDYFIHKLQRKSKRRISQARKAQQTYKAILSTNNETLLFPSHISSDICHQVALCLTDSREELS